MTFTPVRAGIVAAAFVFVAWVGGYVYGRRSAPSRVEERTVYRDREIATKAEATMLDQRGEAESAGKVVIRTRVVKRADGSTVATGLRIVERNERSSQATSASAVRTEVVYKDRIVERERVVEATAPPPWRISAIGGIGLDGRRVWGGEAARSFGSIEVGAWANTDKVAGLMIGVRW